MPYPPPVPGQPPYPVGGQHYPNQPVAPSAPRTMPQQVQISFYVMLAGALVTVLSAAYMLTTIDTIRDNASHASSGVLRGDELDLVVYAGIGGGLLTSAVSAGLWIWMAFACRSGKNWARVTATVFFGINLLFAVIGVIGVVIGGDLGTGTGTDPQSLAFSAVTFLIGVAAMVLLWHPRSSAYFAPAPPPAYAPYPPTGRW
ncbi:hypothetical protein NCAST_33_01520 [Nocardia asteroides NBRC 15531]|uniref:Uncharacterized protein n=2 Tax=Nocardia asteroides TaxID=1824 RepID=U5ENX4_NOCAS|nr:hypothetical protein [Nocardia asteroides NBRC 15531]GAD86774.1 hypothetical protein NCAST_33_01520 [Nocardia asteroides NBRC 15531]